MNAGDFVWFDLTGIVCDKCGGEIEINNTLGRFDFVTQIGVEAIYNFSIMYDITCKYCGLEIDGLILKKSAIDLFQGRITNSNDISRRRPADSASFR